MFGAQLFEIAAWDAVGIGSVSEWRITLQRALLALLCDPIANCAHAAMLWKAPLVDDFRCALNEKPVLLLGRDDSGPLLNKEIFGCLDDLRCDLEESLSILRSRIRKGVKTNIERPLEFV